MIIRRIRPFANDHSEDAASGKWSFGGTGHLHMIIQRIRPLANDHTDDLASFKWSPGWTGLLQMIIRHPHHPNHLSQDRDSISWNFGVAMPPHVFAPLDQTKYFGSFPNFLKCDYMDSFKVNYILTNFESKLGLRRTSSGWDKSPTFSKNRVCWLP